MTVTQVKIGLAAIGALLVFGAGARVGRGCAKPPPPTITQKTDTDDTVRLLREENERLRASSTKTTTRAPVVREKFDAATGKLVERTTAGAVKTTEDRKVSEVKATHEVVEAVERAHTETTVTPSARREDPRLRVYASGAWTAPGLDLGSVSLRPVVRLGAEVRVVDRVSLDMRYEPPFANADKRHNISAELKLSVFEW